MVKQSFVELRGSLLLLKNWWFQVPKLNLKDGGEMDPLWPRAAIFKNILPGRNGVFDGNGRKWKYSVAFC